MSEKKDQEYFAMDREEVLDRLAKCRPEGRGPRIVLPVQG